MPATRKTEASWSEAKQQWRIDVQRDGLRKSFYSSQKGRKECDMSALSEEAWKRLLDSEAKKKETA